jgi:hypothetical protein
MQEVIAKYVLLHVVFFTKNNSKILQTSILVKLHQVKRENQLFVLRG